jgi:hypothetical protein
MEMNFLNSILLSPLHRQSKSPTLWHHRYWLISHSFNPPDFDNLVEDVAWAEQRFQGIFNDELDAVLKAGERHANNYYAWGYGRSLVGFMDSVRERSGRNSTWPRRDEAVSKVLGWCKSHPSDTSGWSFLLFLLLHEKCEGNQVLSTISEVLGFAVAVKWEKEALWNFVRTAIVAYRFRSDQDRKKMVDEVRRVVEMLDTARGATVQTFGAMDDQPKRFPQKVLDSF